jgi:hypothetical protein
VTDSIDPTFAEVYRQLLELADGRCPIEAGLLANIADNECRHGRLPGDKGEACGCWPGEPSAVDRARVAQSNVARVLTLKRGGLTAEEIAARLPGEPERPEAA